VLIGGSVPAAAAALPCRVCDDFATILCQPLVRSGDGRERPLTVGGPIAAVAQLARLLRKAAEQAPLRPPRCDACGMPFDLPLD
jgi:hypothetical protein